jgi:hypothetical protein
MSTPDSLFLTKYEDYSKDEQSHIRMLLRRKRFLENSIDPKTGDFYNRFIRMEHNALVWVLRELENLEHLDEEGQS